MSETLAPCPFCGTTPNGSHMTTSGGYTATAYYCPGCKAQGPLVEIDYATGDERTTGPAAAAWNRRATSLPLPGDFCGVCDGTLPCPQHGNDYPYGALEKAPLATPPVPSGAQRIDRQRAMKLALAVYRACEKAEGFQPGENDWSVPIGDIVDAWLVDPQQPEAE